MKVLFVIFLAIASACASSLRGNDKFQKPIYPLFAPKGRITNGKTGSITRFPYQVGLAVGDSWCGGSILTQKSILTAAHCVYGVFEVSKVVVYAGSATRTGGTRRTASKIIIHSEYNSLTLVNDIAIVKFSSPLSFGSNIAAVELPTSTSNLYVSYPTVASGWGKTSDEGDVVNTLQYIDARVISNNECQSTFGSTCTSNNICISTAGGKSTCNGDSGGPLVVKETKTLIGIASYVSALSCTGRYPAAFTRVTSYLSWINANK